MPAETNQALSSEEQDHLVTVLFDQELFGIVEDPMNFRRLNNGRRSPHYFDIRPALSNVPVRELIVDTLTKVLLHQVDQDEFNGHPRIAYDHIVGNPESMTSYAALVAERNQMPLLQLRADRNKTMGNKSPIMGAYEDGEVVAGLGDVVSGGDTTVDFIGSLATRRLMVRDYIAILDREEGGLEVVEERTGIIPVTAIALSSSVSLLYGTGRINQTQYSNTAEYLRQYGDPKTQAVIL